MMLARTILLPLCVVSLGLAQPITIFNFPDVLNIRNTPSDARDLSASCFSDHGAWHGFALPAEGDTASYGSFPGPRLMHNARWLSKCLARITLVDASDGRPLAISSTSDHSILLYPGLLRQTYTTSALTIQFDLWFATERTSLVRVTVKNLGQQPRVIRIRLEGNLLLDGFTLKQISDGIVARTPKTEEAAVIRLPAGQMSQSQLTQDARAYALQFHEVDIQPNAENDIVFAQSFYMDESELVRDARRMTDALNHPDSSFSAMLFHWQPMLVELLSRGLASAGPPYDRAAVKCLQTLITNWRRPARGLRFDGLFPSYSYAGFNGFWAWDSWKHAAALAPIHPIVARAQVRAMFSAQNTQGMVADCIFPDTTENNWLNTKPPLAGWAVAEILNETMDTAFVRRMLPSLLKYHAWWYRYRDHDGNGLCEYGATSDSLIAAKWESGMDNAIRFDNAALLKNSAEGSWSLDQESVDLNCFLYAEKRALADLLRAVGDRRNARLFDHSADSLRVRIQETFFDPQRGYFFDRRIEDRRFVQVLGPEGWIPLWTGAATERQAAAIVAAIQDPEIFQTFLPFPTVQANHPKFDRAGYWRGPVWIDQAYFAIRGLERYGYRQEAILIREKLLRNLKGFLESDLPIHETYDPLTGSPQNAAHFSWSAAMLMMLLTSR